MCDMKIFTTAGRPDVRQYALMGRLVRGAAFDDQMVYVEPNAVLERVWVDGARGVPTAGHPSRSSVRVLGGDRTSVSHNKFSNSAGPSNVLALGAFDGWPCGGLALRVLDAVAETCLQLFPDLHGYQSISARGAPPPLALARRLRASLGPQAR